MSSPRKMARGRRAAAKPSRVLSPVPTAVPPDSRDGFRPPAPEATPDAWRVEPGDNLWSIATAVVADAIGRPASTTEVADYWRGLIAANHDHVADPDLIHPG